MASISLPSGHGLVFSLNTLEWPQLNKLLTNHEARSRRVTSTREGFQNSAKRENQLLEAVHLIDDDELLKVASDEYSFPEQSSNIDTSNCTRSNIDTSNCTNENYPIKIDLQLKDNHTKLSLVSVENSSSELTQESRDRLAQTSHLHSRTYFLEDKLFSNSTEYSEYRLVSEPGDNDREKANNANNKYNNKKKRLKRIQGKTTFKWKSIDCSCLGFRFFKTLRFPNEFKEEFLNNDIEDRFCSIDTFSEYEAAESVRMNGTKKWGRNNIIKNNLDDIAFFSGLSLDVFPLNFDGYDNKDFLYWDDVQFPKRTYASRFHQNVVEHDTLTVRSQLKPPSTTKYTINKSLPVHYKSDMRVGTYDELKFVPSTSVYSRVKKCDKYRSAELECLTRKRIYIRRDRHRRIKKAHEAIKYNDWRSLFKGHRRKQFYTRHSHRIFEPEMHDTDEDSVGSVISYRSCSMSTNNCHALHDANCAEHLESGLATFLISLQHRDLTPEDYDMLLQLDDTVKPKTVSENVLEKLRTEQIGSNGPDHGSSDWEPLCTICMEPYVAGQERKFLPCEHDFHTPCIDRWLTNSSLNCPLDGLPIGGS